MAAVIGDGRLAMLDKNAIFMSRPKFAGFLIAAILFVPLSASNVTPAENSSASNIKSPAVRITTCRDRSRTVFELVGRLTGPRVEEFKDCRQRAVSCGERVTVVLKQVSYFDSAGKTLLAEIYRQTAQSHVHD